MRGQVKSDAPVQRLRFTFSMAPMLRFVSHLDMAKAWERTFRRADLPMAFSQGYHPMPKMQFAAALPVGVWGEAELLDLWLVERVAPALALERVGGVLPPGLNLRGVEEVALGEPALQAALLSGEYEACVEGADRERIEAAVRKFLASDFFVYTRRTRKKTRDIDIRPLVEVLELLEPRDGRTCLRMLLSHRQGASVRAFDVLDALGVDPLAARVVRKGLVVAKGSAHRRAESRSQTGGE